VSPSPVTELTDTASGRIASLEGPAIEAILVDYAGVLTNPLKELYAAFSRACGLSPDEIMRVMTNAAIEYGRQPLEALEVGEISEQRFLELVDAAVERELGKTIDLSEFRWQWFAGVVPNVEFMSHLRRLRDRGYRLALVTNNVGEWREVWEPTVPLSDFELVVDSSSEHSRKPEVGIYQSTLAKLALDGPACVFVDDVWEHCATAQRLGMHPIWFQSTRQAVYELDRELARHPVP
jgi:putative hydrolase of the HAD superfamily